MENTKETSKNSTMRLVKILYVISAVIAVIFVYMLIVNVLYINDYVASYGMSFGDMWAEAVQYVIAGSLSYLVYAILVFGAGKIISILSTGCCVPQVQDEEQPEAEMEEESEEKPEPVKQRRKRRYMK